MNIKNIKSIYCISVLLATLLCALFIIGCDSAPKTQKAQISPPPPVASPAPVKSTAQTTSTLPAAQAVTVVQSMIGKYKNKKFPDDSMELKSNSTFIIKEGKSTLSGNFAIQGNNLIMSLSDGSGSKIGIDERGITDSNGILWTKQ